MDGSAIYGYHHERKLWPPEANHSNSEIQLNCRKGSWTLDRLQETLQGRLWIKLIRAEDVCQSSLINLCSYMSLHSRSDRPFSTCSDNSQKFCFRCPESCLAFLYAMDVLPEKPQDLKRRPCLSWTPSRMKAVCKPFRGWFSCPCERGRTLIGETVLTTKAKLFQLVRIRGHGLPHRRG